MKFQIGVSWDKCGAAGRLALTYKLELGADMPEAIATPSREGENDDGSGNNGFRVFRLADNRGYRDHPILEDLHESGLSGWTELVNADPSGKPGLSVFFGVL
jgi:hypothetical protein